jgi:hypothetical protein
LLRSHPPHLPRAMGHLQLLAAESRRSPDVYR